MRDSMRHRGPDGEGVWISADRQVGLAHRRLAIIDLSSNGLQPMADRTGRYWITFNGEIYNFRELRVELAARGSVFRTVGDTEVILEAYRTWGRDCLHHFNGMFAFALYDTVERRLFLARDRAGEKPLYYYHHAGEFRFASELKAFMADPAFPRRLNMQALNEYLTFGYVPCEHCILDGVRKLAQGQALLLDVSRDQLETWNYWQLPKPAAKPVVDSEELMLELERLLFDSVRLRMEADVPVGILLSGGLDSSLVTSLAARCSSRPVRTFTITFPGHGKFDEGPFARIVARHFGTEHTEMEAEAVTSDLLPLLAKQFDEPMADSSMLPTFLVSRLIRQQATVALGGDGGDELFGGYPHNSWLARQEQLRHWLPAPFRRCVSAGAARLLPPGTKGRNYLLSLGGDFARSVAQVNVYFDQHTRRRLLSPCQNSLAQPDEPEADKARACSTGSDLVQAACAMDFRTYLADDILVKVDRASMLASLEVRAPMLDHRLIEFAFTQLPGSIKANSRERKILLRRLGTRLLPPDLELNRKQGFSLPLQSWFRGEWADFITGVLAESEERLFDRAVIRSLLAGQQYGLNNTQRIFALVIFELWRREYRISV